MRNAGYEIACYTYDNVAYGNYTADQIQSDVDHWTEVKIKSGKEGNKGMRQIAKLMLNSLY